MAKIDVSKVFNKQNLETIGKIARTGCEYAARGVILLLSVSSVKDIVDTARYCGKVGYSDAVSAIMSSGMLSSDKNEAVTSLPKNGDAELYRAVIQIVRSGMLSSDKVKTIQNICENK